MCSGRTASLLQFPRRMDGAVKPQDLHKVIIPGYHGQDDTKRTAEYVYWGDMWNWLDIICVVTGYMEFLSLADNMSALRVCPSRRREFCHFADIPSPSLLKHLLKGEGGAAE